MDISDELVKKLQAAGFKTETPESIRKALETCIIVPADGKVRLVVAIAGGLFHDAFIFTGEEEARTKQDELDESFKLKRDNSGAIMNDSDDWVGLYDVRVNSPDSAEEPHSPWTGNRL